MYTAKGIELLLRLVSCPVVLPLALLGWLYYTLDSLAWRLRIGPYSKRPASPPKETPHD